jgi:16S rRNA (cytidine1402-2'-O)-methyltransferase
VNEKRTLILYESPHRILRTLEDMRGVFMDRIIAVAKEITKIHEHVLRGPVPEVEQMLKDTRIAGEYVIIVEGSPTTKQEVNSETVQEVRALMEKGIGRKEAVKIIAGMRGVDKKDLYRQSIG